ncbi:hypothetical protein [Paracoccus mutanolyticus]|uniref:hypothetical protein n=1 Tax=Paracoccus mutanolyticus TaxID=1499308 RepID=UPI0011AE6EC3|nr:hypothetical protein [Paracoccus mutanolyticus]
MRGGFGASRTLSGQRAIRSCRPVGTGWGYDCGAPIVHADFIIIPVTVWYRDRANTFVLRLGCSEIIGKQPDSDAPRGVADALTKAVASWLQR